MDQDQVVPGRMYIPTRPKSEQERCALPRWTPSMDRLDGVPLKCFALSEKTGYVRLIVPDRMVGPDGQDSFWFKAEWLKPGS